MFEKMLRKGPLKDMSEYDQDLSMLHKERYITDFIAMYIIIFLQTTPLLLPIFMLILDFSLDTLVFSGFFLVCQVIFLVWFNKNMLMELRQFRASISDHLYAKMYALRGNAISKADFEIIKEQCPALYFNIVHQRCNGYCYSVCFELLRLLKKGSIHFLAIKRSDRSMEVEGHEEEYTMHVLYVNHGWCFDTFSQRQLPLDEALRRFKVKPYKSFSYADIDGRTYEEFSLEQHDAFAKWCKENSCYQKWHED